MAIPAIEFRDVHRRLGGHEVLSGIDIRVADGESVALVGINGAGKSTLIKVLVDLRARDSGSVRIGGRENTDRHARINLAYLPEHFLPPYFLRGVQYLDYMARLYHSPQSRQESVATAARLGLPAENLDRPVRAYSKGMAQMLGLTACLASGRGLLVLDEPMSGLDPTARVRLQRLLREARDAGRTVFFSTHLMQDAAALADRVLVLHEGRIVADAAPGELAAAHGGDLEAAFVHCVGSDAGARDAATG